MNEVQVSLIVYWATRVFVLIVIVGAGVGIGYYLGDRRPDRKFVWWPAVVAASFAVLSVLGTLSSISTLSSSGGEVAAPAVHVRVSVLPAPKGASFANFGGAQSEKFRSDLDQAVKAALKGMGQDVGSVTTDVSALGSEPDGLIFGSARNNQGIFEAHIVGLRAGNMIEIICASDDPLRASFDVADAPCGEAIKDRFGQTSLSLLKAKKHG